MMLAVSLVLAIVGLLLPVAVLKAVVVQQLWRWFVVPVFGLPVLSLPAAFGLALLVSILTHEYTKGCERPWYESLGLSLLTPLFALLSGWIVSWWM